MFKKIQQISSALLITLSMTSAVAVLAPAVTAHATAVTSGLCEGITAAEDANGNGTNSDACTNDPNATSNVNRLIKNVINLFSLIVGAVSVIMIVYGGFKYITSGGNDGNVSGAKNTILYALIGLVIVALAQVIVRFVLTKATA
jgi:cytochrome bd-type quinol oxidase subunit 2